MKKILLIGDSTVNDSPHIMSYIEVLENNHIPYDLLFWNRNLDSTEHIPENYIAFNCFTSNKYPYWKRAFKIANFAKFSCKQMINTEYAYVVVFTIAHALFMYKTLKKYYKGRYIFDIRDFSPICKVFFLRKVMYKLIENSAYTVISSAGFMRWLPKGDKYRYVVAHNTTKGMMDKYIDNKEITPPSPRTPDFKGILT